VHGALRNTIFEGSVETSKDAEDELLEGGQVGATRLYNTPSIP
jgi:hypothetical protein